MRFFLFGPRIMGVRPGVSLGPEDFRRSRVSPSPISKAEGAFVYVVKGDHALIKIGISTNPSARLAQLRTASAFPIDFAYLAAVDGDASAAFDVEQSAHSLLSRNRMNGEWFDVAPEMAVAALAAASQKIGRKIIQIEPGQADQIISIAKQTPQTAQSSAIVGGFHVFGVILAFSIAFGMFCAVYFSGH